MSDIYCGIGKVPKGQRLGNMKECAEKGQVRYYGIKKIDPKTIELTKKKDKIPETRDKLIIKISGLKGSINKFKGRYETTKEKDKKEEYHKQWKKAEAELKEAIAKFEKVEKEREKTKSKSRTKSRSKK